MLNGTLCLGSLSAARIKIGALEDVNESSVPCADVTYD